MSKRVRVVSYYIKPELMVDDGETLQPLELDTVRVFPGQWPQVVDLVEEALARFRAQVETPNGNGPPQVVDLDGVDAAQISNVSVAGDVGSPTDQEPEE